MATKQSNSPLAAESQIVVRKTDRKLTFGDKIYKIILGFEPLGDKEIEGDGKTPEGNFYVFTKNDKSKYFLSLGISYPDTEDAKRGLAAGLISEVEHDEIVDAIQNRKKPPQNTALGGEIYIHGGGTERDWTRGCIAMNDKEMKELFDSVPVGIRVTILS